MFTSYARFPELNIHLPLSVANATRIVEQIPSLLSYSDVWLDCSRWFSAMAGFQLGSHFNASLRERFGGQRVAIRCVGKTTPTDPFPTALSITRS